MARSKKVTKEALKSIIADGLRNSAGYYGGELMRRREKALEFYLGYPMGNEVEGRSRVISTDLMDTISQAFEDRSSACWDTSKIQGNK